MYNRDTDAIHIQAISSGPRIYGRQVNIYKTSSETKTDEDDPGFVAKNEIDTKDNTICSGTNWRILSASGQCYDVYGFHDNFKGVEDVTITRVSTGICDVHGRMHILIINQALYFGISLDHSLINTNQIRHFGIMVSLTSLSPGTLTMPEH